MQYILDKLLSSLNNHHLIVLSAHIIASTCLLWIKRLYVCISFIKQYASQTLLYVLVCTFIWIHPFFMDAFTCLQPLADHKSINYIQSSIHCNSMYSEGIIWCNTSRSAVISIASPHVVLIKQVIWSCVTYHKSLIFSVPMTLWAFFWALGAFAWSVCVCARMFVQSTLEQLALP